MNSSRAMTVLVVVLAACGGDDEPPTGQPTEPATRSPETSPTATPDEAETWPLTGLPAPDGVADRPALTVKIDNSGPAEPQLGLAGADVVAEELIEGGMTRLAAVYHSTLPEQVGPVRSIRTSDIGIVLPTGGALVASGGAQRVLGTMDEVGVPVITEGAAGFARDADRRAPYNVMVDLDETLSEVSDLGPPAEPYLSWADQESAGLEGDDVTGAAVRFSGAHTTTWELSDGSWTRQPGLAAAGDEFAADNVLILHVRTRDAGYTDPAGNFVPETVFEDSGEALLLTGGTAVDAEWSKDELAAPIRLTDGVGDPLDVPAGRTWIELVPENGSVDTSR